MINPSSSPCLDKLIAILNKWRIALLIFALVYLVVLLLNLTDMPMQWDEVVHLNGALTLNTGHYSNYVSTAFYPPLYDLATAVSFQVFGTSLFSARLVSAVFSVLSLGVVFELAYTMYNGKTALLTTILLGIMPGYFWLSRQALLEIMLLFFVMVTLLVFFRWIQNKKDKYLVLAGLAVGLGFLTKYQAVVAGVIMVISLVFLVRHQLRRVFSRFILTVVAAVLVVVPWIVIAYQVYASKIFSQWIYALQVGNPEKSIYSDRYPSPIFYLIDIVWPYNNFHPISIFIYIFGLAGLGFLIWRHNKSDQYIILWFATVFVFFSLIANKEWRYVLPLFSALAISASVLILFLYNKIDTAWKQKVQVKKKTGKIAAVLFIILVLGAMAYSINDAYSITSSFNIQIQLEPATVYAINHMQNNESIMVLAPFNFFSQDMIRFYLAKNGNTQIQTYQYPLLPTDTYTPTFNITELINECKQYHVKYLFTYEQGGTFPYYNTTVNPQQVFEQLYASGNFSHISDETTFGSNPRRIFILTFEG
jgi:4-amino-4-deoxy-L-arabinose transferase-like glycosyltransferase